MKLLRLFNEFFESEKAGGILLIFCTVISLILANSTIGQEYQHVWHFKFAGQSFEFWINDLLMSIFFLLIGLELSREIYNGELSGIRKASLPIVLAIGGMIVPVLIYFIFNFRTPTQPGAGIPMATDIAFAIGILSLLGNRVPFSLKILLTSLAVIDDLGAILAIAVFYTGNLSFINLGIALSIFGILLLLNRLGIRNLIPYLCGGAIMWYFMLHSGIHVTIAGVLLAFVIPFGNGDEKSPSYLLQKNLHKPVAFFILPLFALANTCVVIRNDWFHGLGEPASIGIILGLLLGKPIGIFLFSFIFTVTGVCVLPENVKLKHILGVGFLAGIGFTMSIFITLLAFNDTEIITLAKIAIMIASLFSGIIGFVWLKRSLDTK